MEAENFKISQFLFKWIFIVSINNADYVQIIFLSSGGTSTGDPVCVSVCFTQLFENFQNRFRDFLYTPELIYDHSCTGLSYS